MQNSGISIIIKKLEKIKSAFKEKIQKSSAASLELKKVETEKQRQLVGNIIIAVLTERMPVRKALLLFPKGFTDPSIHAAWHALCHYEADEDIKVQDIEFNNQQVELLELIAFTFKDGNPLAQNIIDAYKPYYQDDPVSYENGINGIIKKLFRFLNF